MEVFEEQSNIDTDYEEEHQHVVAYMSGCHSYSFFLEASSEVGVDDNVRVVTSKGVPTPVVTMVAFPETQKVTSVTFEVVEETILPEEKVQPYMNLSHKELVHNYRLFHFVVSKQDVRALLVNVTHSVDDIILKICATFGICNAEEYFLWLPKGLDYTLQKKSSTLKQRTMKSFDKLKHNRGDKQLPEFNFQLDGKASIRDQYDFSIRPYILYMSKHAPDEDVDAGEMDKVGEEWPDFEDPNIASQREFHQSWCGVVQGDYPMERESVIHLAALLSQVYHGNYEEQLDDYSPTLFLPPSFAKSPPAARKVTEEYKTLAGKDKTEAMKEVIELCRSKVTYEGLFFNVEVPASHSTLKKSKQRSFGINHMGVVNVDSYTGKVLFVHRFSDIHNGRCGEDILHLDFLHWDLDYYAYTKQSKTIMDLLRIYIDMAKRGVVAQTSNKPSSK